MKIHCDCFINRACIVQIWLKERVNANQGSKNAILMNVGMWKIRRQISES